MAGWKPGTGRRAGTFGSLLLGINDDDGLRYVGHVGTGFDERALRELSSELAARAVERAAVRHPGAAGRRRGTRTGSNPSLVGEVAFAEWTGDGRLRQPAWRGLRPDKAPSEVVRES